MQKSPAIIRISSAFSVIVQVLQTFPMVKIGLRTAEEFELVPR